MGASQSSNVAKSIANVSNKISDETSANANQVNNISNNVRFQNCTVNGKQFQVNENATNIQKSKQIASSIQNSNVKNDIQQELLQNASSTVGSLGLGYADSNNSASMFVNASTDIIQSIETTCGQINNELNTFDCENSTINVDNILINLGTSNTFLSDQTVQSQQISDISNQISQKADQKATSSVEGLTGLLIAIAIIIIALGYTITKPLDSTPLKILFAVILVIVLIIITIFMYIKKTPPFFNDDNDCIPYQSSYCNSECINLNKKNNTISLPPFRYIYPITPSGLSSSQTGANLLQMLISSKKGENSQNGGYNTKTMSNIDKYFQKNPSNIYYQFSKVLNIDLPPNPLILPNNNSFIPIPPEYGGNYQGTYINNNICSPSSLIYTSPTDSNPTNFQPNSNGTLNCPISAKLIPDTNQDPTKVYLVNLNTDWDNYIKTSTTHSQFARFILCDLLGDVIPLNIYIDKNEYVKCRDENNNVLYGQAKDENISKYVYELVPNSTYTDFSLALNGGGELVGYVGVCNDTTYKFHHFMRTWGIGIIIILLILVFYFLFFHKSKEENKSKEEINK